MIQLKVERNDEDQRLDRFLKKYYGNAGLSTIYKMIRKEVKVNGKRRKIDYRLEEGDVISIFIDEKVSSESRTAKKSYDGRRFFSIIYEDEDTLIVDKPAGLLVHGDEWEKKRTLVNYVCGYLMDKGEFHPGREHNFSPAPANRLDRNTCGLVIFGKTAAGLKTLNQLVASANGIEKEYWTIVGGSLNEDMKLLNEIGRGPGKNMMKVDDGEDRKVIETEVYPLTIGDRFTYAKIRLITGRTHQIRAHLASVGHPVIGDTKYGDSKINREMQRKYGLKHQLLYAGRLTFKSGYLSGKAFSGNPPKDFVKIGRGLFGELDFSEDSFV